MTADDQQVDWVPDKVDLTSPNSARVYDFMLGGACNFAADRDFAQRVLTMLPDLRGAAVQNRAFLRRAVEELTELGIRQFLDIGSGIPTVGNTHEVAQRSAPGSRVVYVDNEPMAVAHSEMMLRDNPDAAIVNADMRDPDGVLSAVEDIRLLDFTEPIALIMCAILHFVPEDGDPLELLARYRAALIPGSYLVISHGTDGEKDQDTANSAASMYDRTATPLTLRSRGRIAELFTGWELEPPGVVYTTQWRPEFPEEAEREPERSLLYGGLARKA
ncbi:S-adenosyl methyltransferase [Tamaricihabitans halophyticus]|uniref:S-adenosyl methyltransferase n=1 Tax=Tamaricihabitans halophyticus TaxID=1262583 RepID=A0A4R2QXM2_9PSEU|nr:SAM-dependent methyltransferase [Tamaricihabitans halophyticus]TCP54903.1 S-adenosyl methyltransferase [Tamaricihabitans halophyticus]